MLLHDKRYHVTLLTQHPPPNKYLLGPPLVSCVLSNIFNQKHFCEECIFIPCPTKLPDSFSKNNAHLESGVHILFWGNPMPHKYINRKQLASLIF